MAERLLSDTEYERLGRALEAADGAPGVSAVSLAAIRLLLLIGCRKNEILRLRWEEVDLMGGELRLADFKTRARVIACRRRRCGCWNRCRKRLTTLGCCRDKGAAVT